MATVYLLVVHYIDDGDGVDDITTVARNRAFVSPEVRVTAARRLIDDMLSHFNPRALPPERMVEVLDHIDDMLFARKQNDITYELLCCRDIFNCMVEFQDITIELEELMGEIIN
jgi:hypothetical protein